MPDHVEQPARAAHRAQELARVVEVRPGYRGEGGHLAHHRLVGDGGPGLDGAPVVSQQVDATDADVVDDRADVGTQLREAVIRSARRTGGLPGPADVVGDEVIASGKVLGDAVPQVVVVGVAVNGQHGRPLRVDLGIGVHGQRDTVRGGHGAAGRQVRSARRGGGHLFLSVSARRVRQARSPGSRRPSPPRPAATDESPAGSRHR